MIFEITITLLLIFLIIKIHDAIDVLLRIRFFLLDIARTSDLIKEYKAREADAKELEATSQFIEKNITPFMDSIFKDLNIKEVKVGKVKKSQNKK